jgi:hypothetical protein
MKGPAQFRHPERRDGSTPASATMNIRGLSAAPATPADASIPQSAIRDPHSK